MSVNNMRFASYRNLYIQEYDFFDNIIYRLNKVEYPTNRQIPFNDIMDYISERIIFMVIDYAKLYMGIDIHRDFIGYWYRHSPNCQRDEGIISFYIEDTLLSESEKELYESVFDVVAEDSWRPKVGPNIFTIEYNKKSKGDEINVNRRSRSKPPRYSRPYY